MYTGDPVQPYYDYYANYRQIKPIYIENQPINQLKGVFLRGLLQLI